MHSQPGPEQPSGEFDRKIESRRLPSPQRILIVDDDIMVCSALAAVLQSEGYAALQSNNGEAALARALSDPPDLALLDLNMPGLDGWATFAQLKAQAPWLPVVVITALPHQFEEAGRRRVDAFMEKPLSITALLEGIRDLLDKTVAARHTRTARPDTVTIRWPSS